MSMHRITAGSGYEYLTRQVARHDSTENARASLASYYSDKGEIPGQWVGTGMAGITGLDAGDEVTAEQMRALFGCGYHPLADAIAREYRGPGHTQRDYERAIALGQPFRVYSDDISPFRIEVARRFDAHNRAQGRRGDAPIALDVRAQIRTEVARSMFVAEYGRQPLDAREMSGHLARLSRQHTTAVAGFDLTFSPVKSVSALWATTDPHTAARIEGAHNQAVATALSFIESRALYSREGAGGVRQVDTKGLVAASFTHRDSRAGDPDLHTHVAVANKVQTVEGRWLSIHSKVLYKANVSASEVYNTTLERLLAEDLGVRFAARPGYAPDGWTHLVDHLHQHGVHDDEMIAAGLASRASTGRLIDRFRDRVVFPITDEQGRVLGFAGRRNPARDNDPRTPKYLNTADTALFHKGAQLFAPPRLLAADATPVIVEGPMDAIAVTLVGYGRYVGVAPLGTALTDEQAHHLLTDRLLHLPPRYVLPEALRVVAAQPANQWDISEAALIGATGTPAPLVRLALKDQINAFNTDPREAAQDAHHRIRTLYERRNRAATTREDDPTPPQTDQPRTRPIRRPVEPIPANNPHHGVDR